jgi:hypothetical protein
MFLARGFSAEALHVAYNKARKTQKQQTKNFCTRDLQIDQPTSTQSTPTTPTRRRGAKLITKYHTKLDVLHKDLTTLHTRATTHAIRVAQYTHRTRRSDAIPPTPSPPIMVWKRQESQRHAGSSTHTIHTVASYAPMLTHIQQSCTARTAGVGRIL